MTKEDIIKKFNIDDPKAKLLEKYILELKNTNHIHNLVGKSTLSKVWDRHIADSIQITPLIRSKNASILDMGTGGGLPGLILSIMGYKNVTLVDSKKKKIDFLKKTIKKLGLKTKTINSRLERLKIAPFRYVTSRALAPLSQLLNYSLFFSNRNTTLVFLKGRNVNSEINEAKKNFIFIYKKYKSQSEGEGFVLKIKDLKKND